jgi:hypothetical protein
MSTERSWTPLGHVAPTELADTRLQLHWAAQPVAAVGTTFLPAEPDWSHSTLEWRSDVAALAGRPLPAAGGGRMALRLEDLTLLWLDPDATASESFPLQGRTLGDASDWAMSTVAQKTGEDLSPLELAPYELPEHAVSDGAPFTAAPEHLAELSRWYADADLVLQSVATATEASAVRTWPHHFDIATLLTLDAELGSEKGPSIGVGMTPGDGGYAEPYVYITPYPYPEASSLSELSSGAWHTDGWVGAVLRGTELVQGDGPEQRARLERFVREA